jgi:phosphatidylglycerol:prolipoprotein diacylglycerol transferase
MLPYLNLGPLGFPTAPLVVLIGAWLSLYAVDRAARRLGHDPERLYGLAAVMMVAGFVGARLAFVLLHWSSYDDNLLGILWPLNSGFSGIGGVLIAAAGGYFYARWKRIPAWEALDTLSPGIILFLMTLSLADFLGGAGYGSLTSMPWGITNYGVRRHAVQLYELLAGVLALAAWWAATDTRLRDVAGRPFLLTTAIYALGRLFVDAFRENAWLTPGGYHVVQIIALLIALGCLALLASRSGHSSHTGRASAAGPEQA